MRYVRRLGIALLTFVFGVALSPIRFDVEGMGYGKVSDGGGFSITSYKSSYFVNLLSVYEAYVSREQANEIFDEHVSKATKVIEVGPSLTEKVLSLVVGQWLYSTLENLLVLTPKYSGQKAASCITYAQLPACT